MYSSIFSDYFDFAYTSSPFQLLLFPNRVVLGLSCSVPAFANPWLFTAITQDKSPLFSAYLKLLLYEVISASSERFLSVNNGRVITQLIKGPRPRLVESEQIECSSRIFVTV